MTEDQRAMKELLEDYCVKLNVSLVSFLAHYRKVDEPIGDLIERVYTVVEEVESRK